MKYKLFIAVKTSTPNGGGIHSSIVEFNTEDEAEDAINQLDRTNEASNRSTVWGIRYEITRLWR